jgi:hypothetical protein
MRIFKSVCFFDMLDLIVDGIHILKAIYMISRGNSQKDLSTNLWVSRGLSEVCGGMQNRFDPACASAQPSSVVPLSFQLSLTRLVDLLRETHDSVSMWLLVPHRTVVSVVIPRSQARDFGSFIISASMTLRRPWCSPGRWMSNGSVMKSWRTLTQTCWR